MEFYKMGTRLDIEENIHVKDEKFENPRGYRLMKVNGMIIDVSGEVLWGGGGG